MKLIDNFRIGFKNYIIRATEYTNYVKEDELIKHYGLRNLKLSFLTNIFGIITYSPTLDVVFGEDILEVMTVINNRQNFKYIEDEDNHKKFIIVANLLEHYDWLEWGTSIRGCWFTDYGKPKLFPRLDEYGMSEIKFDSEGKDMNELLDYLNSESI